LEAVKALRTRALVAFDASGVAGAIVSAGLGGRRLRSFSQAPLPAGALAPSPFEANLIDPAAVQTALSRVREALGAGETGACLLLPAGVARVVLMDVPAGTDAEGYARFRLASSLPYAASEAVVDLMPAGTGRVVAAAVRRSVVQEYEKVAEAAGLRQTRLDLAPLAALGALLRASAGAARTVDVILGDVAVSLSAHADGALRAFRTRWRDPGLDEARWLAEEARRTAELAGPGAAPRLRVVGPGASRFVQAWTAAGLDAAPGWVLEGHGLPMAAAELCWLGGALA
jgi:hypothetical protein